MTKMTPRLRGGRPRREQAGEVERRLLDAALQLFLERGFGGTSCEEVVGLAGAGKASLYARFPNKERLFEAVVRRHVETLLVPVEVASLSPLEERLRCAGRHLLEHALQPRTLAMMRLVIATSDRFPELAAEVNRIGWKGGRERVRQAILAGDDRPADPGALADQFIDLVFAPHQLRALLGEDRGLLLDAIAPRVDGALRLLVSAGALLQNP